MRYIGEDSTKLEVQSTKLEVGSLGLYHYSIGEGIYYF